MSQSTDPLLGMAGAASSSSSSAVPSAWESARKKSRQLETQLYKKLQEFAQVQTVLMNDAVQGRRNNRAGNIDLEMGRAAVAGASVAAAAAAAGSAGLAGLSPLLQYEQLTGELEQLLSSFSLTIDAMARMLSDGGDGSGGGGGLATEANQYLLSKARQTLQENTLEFRRTKQNITAALTRQELMAGAAERRAETSSTERGRTEQLLREGRSLQHSLERTDDVMAQAAAARESLLSQGRVFAGVRGKLTTLGTTFPVVGKLMSRINVSKQRDMIVLACVIATCMFFTLIYILSKP